MQDTDNIHPAPIPPLTILVIGILAASTSSIFIRFAQQEVHSIVIASYRLTIATILLLPWALTRYRSDFFRLQPRQWLQTITAGVFLGAHFGTWISSLAFTSVTSSVVLVQTTPVFVLLISPLVLREKPTVWIYLGLTLAVIGSITIALSDSCSLPLDSGCFRDLLSMGAMTMKGDVLALTGAICGAVYLMIGRTIRKVVPLIPYITLVYGFAAITLLIVAFFSGLPFTGYSPKMYLWFLLLALFPQLLAHSSYNWALRYLPATSVSLSLLGEPVSAAFLAYLILSESIPALRWIGAIIVLAGIVIALYRPKTTLQGTPKIDKIQE